MSDVRHCPNPECGHRVDTGASAEYRSQVETCADCGSVLRHGPASRAPTVESPTQSAVDLGRTVTVAICRDPIQTQFAVGILEDAGIPHLIAGQSASSVFGGVLNNRIRVPVERADEAKRVLADEGLALGGSGPAYDEARANVAEATKAETRRRGMKPLLFFLLMLLLYGLATVLRKF